MTCDRMKELLSAYIDGALSPAEKSRVKKHLEGCAGCRDELSNLTWTVRRLRDLADVEPPPGLSKKVMGRIGREKRPAGTLERILGFPRQLGIPLQVAASAIIVAAAAYTYSTFKPRHQAEEPREYIPAEVQQPVKKEVHAAGGPAQKESDRARIARKHDSIEKESPQEPPASVPLKKMIAPPQRPVAENVQEDRIPAPADHAPVMARVPRVEAETPMVVAKVAPQAPPAEVMRKDKVEGKFQGSIREEAPSAKAIIPPAPVVVAKPEPQPPPVARAGPVPKIKVEEKSREDIREKVPPVMAAIPPAPAVVEKSVGREPPAPRIEVDASETPEDAEKIGPQVLSERPGGAAPKANVEEKAKEPMQEGTPSIVTPAPAAPIMVNKSKSLTPPRPAMESTAAVGAEEKPGEAKKEKSPPVVAKAPLSPTVADEPDLETPPAPPAEQGLEGINDRDEPGGEMPGDTSSEEGESIQEAGGVHIVVYADELQTAAERAGGVVRDSGGIAIVTRSNIDKWVIIADVPSRNVSALRRKLKTIGKTKVVEELPQPDDKYVRIVVEILPAP